MTLIRTTASRVREEQPSSLVKQLLEQMLYRTGRRPSPSEQTSWRRSLSTFATDLVDAGLDDVRIGNWGRPWNSKSDRKIGDAPPSALWATEDGGFGQIGCVYTAQGFEYDWSGVIIGDDLVWGDGRFVTVRDNNRDPNFRSKTLVRR